MPSRAASTPRTLATPASLPVNEPPCWLQCQLLTPLRWSPFSVRFKRACQTKEVPTMAVRSHGMSGTPTYRSWEAMVRRCSVEKDPSYENYGGRGITVCENWLSFEGFFKDMGLCPPGLTIDRLDPSGPYAPNNCRWATRLQQGENRRGHKFLETAIGPVFQAEAARLNGLSPGTLHARIKAGWTDAEATTAKLGHKRDLARSCVSDKLINFGGVELHQAEMARLHGLSPATLHARLKLGWSEEKALTTPARGKIS